MSRQVGLLYSEEKKHSAKIYEGFSWTCFFFGPLWFLYKGLNKMALICFLLDLFAGGLIPRIILSFFSNEMHKNHLLAQGYQAIKSFDNNQNINFNKFKTTNLTQKDSRKNEIKMDKIINLKNEIIRKIDKSKQLDENLTFGIRSMLDNYVEQTKLLIEKEKKFANILEGYSIKDINSNIEELKKKSGLANNEKLKNEYDKMISMYDTQKKSYNEVCEQREMIELKLDSVLMNLNRLKLDLVKMEGIINQEQTEFILKTFQEKTESLSNYVGYLKKSYNDLDSLNVDREL